MVTGFNLQRVNKENLEIIVPKHVIVSIKHVIMSRVYVLLVAVDVDIQGQTVV